MQIVSQVISTVAPTMPIEHPKEADLGPLHSWGHLFVPRLQNIQDNAHSVFVVVTDDPLVRIGCIRLYVAAFLLARLCWLVVFQVDRFRVEVGSIPKQQRLHIYELNIRVGSLLFDVWQSLGLLAVASRRSLL